MPSIRPTRRFSCHFKKKSSYLNTFSDHTKVHMKSNKTTVRVNGIEAISSK